MSICPTAAATRPTSRRSMRHWTRCGGTTPTRCRAWCSTWPAPTRTKATASGRLKLTVPVWPSATGASSGLPRARHAGGGEHGRRLRPRHRRHRRDPPQHLARGLKRVALDERSAGCRPGSLECAARARRAGTPRRTTMTVWGIPLDFILFALTLLGVAVFHHRTLEVALTGAVVITLYQLFTVGFKTGPGVAGLLGARRPRVGDAREPVRPAPGLRPARRPLRAQQAARHAAARAARRLEGRLRAAARRLRAVVASSTTSPPP